MKTILAIILVLIPVTVGVETWPNQSLSWRHISKFRLYSMSSALRGSFLSAEGEKTKGGIHYVGKNKDR